MGKKGLRISPWGDLEEITYLQVLQQKFEMVVAMLAAPAGVVNASPF